MTISCPSNGRDTVCIYSPDHSGFGAAAQERVLLIFPNASHQPASLCKKIISILFSVIAFASIHFTQFNIDGFFCQPIFIDIIGATGFEPATSRPPAERATKLRHTPYYKYFAQRTSVL